MDESIVRFRLGEVVRPADGHSRYRGAVSIPYLNPDNTVRSIRFRTLQGTQGTSSDGPSKYLGEANVPLHLYNVTATSERRVWLCEGEFDSMVLSQMDYPAAGVPGVNGFKPAWRYLFSSCEQVTIVFDSDEPGKKGAHRLSTILGPVIDGLRIVHLPLGMDITDIYKRSPDELRALVG